MSYPHIMYHGSVNGSWFQLQMDARNHSKQLISIGGNAQYMRTCHYLVVTGRSVMVDASSGICASGRIVYDLKVMSSLSGHNMFFTRYQGQYRAGSVIQKMNSKAVLLNRRVSAVLSGQAFTLGAVTQPMLTSRT
jgi:Cft2 family RNA processing exonuclease